MFDNVLDGDDGVGSVGHDTAGCDRHRFPGREGARRRHARSDAGDDRQAARRIRRAYGEPVHRRARERRQVDDGTCVLGEHPAGGGRDCDTPTVERRDLLEHARLRLREREQLGHLAPSVAPR